MNLDDIKEGQSVLIDANTYIYGINKNSVQCSRFLRRCAGGEVKGILPLHVLSEINHRLMISEAKEVGLVSGSNPTKQLSKIPKKIMMLRNYRAIISDLLKTSLIFETFQKEDFLIALKIQRQYGLLTNDSLLIAIGSRLEIYAIATSDNDFQNVEGLTIYSPDDIIF
jgi:predicted nucleic acid-binding protein